MKGLATAGKVVIDLTFIVYLAVVAFKTVFAMIHQWNTDPLDPGPLIWTLLESTAYAFAFLVCGMGAIFAVMFCRLGSETTRCVLARRSGRPYLIIPKEMAQRSIHGLGESMLRNLGKGHRVQFVGEIGDWCRDLEGTYRISTPLISGRWIVTFSNANDAFAFKMRWL